MSQFNPYQQWLGLPARAKPFNFYELLELPAFEANSERIAQAADRALAKVRSFRPGEQGKEWAKLLDELSQARRCLIDPAAKAKYDAQLRQTQAAAAAASAQRRAASGPPEQLKYPPGMAPKSASGASATERRSSQRSAPSSGESSPADERRKSLYPPSAGGAKPSRSPAAKPTLAQPKPVTPAPVPVHPQGTGRAPVPASPSYAPMPGDPMAAAPAIPQGYGAAPHAQTYPTGVAPQQPMGAHPVSAHPMGALPMATPIQSPATAYGQPGAQPYGGPGYAGYGQASPDPMAPAAPAMGGYILPAAPVAYQPYNAPYGTPYGTPAGPMANPAPSYDPMAPVAAHPSPMAAPMAQPHPMGAPMAAPLASVHPVQPAVGVPAGHPAAPSPVISNRSASSVALEAQKRNREMQRLLVFGGVSAALLLLCAAIAYPFVSNYLQGETIADNSLPVVPTAPLSPTSPMQVNTVLPPATPPMPPSVQPAPVSPTPAIAPPPAPAPMPVAAPPATPGPMPMQTPMPANAEPATPTMATNTPPAPMPAPAPTPEPPAAPATPPQPAGPTRQELFQLRKALTTARDAFSEQNFAEGEQQIAAAEKVAKTPEHQAMVERLRTVGGMAKQFRQAVVDAIQGLEAGEVFTVGTSTQVAVVETFPDKIIVRIVGQNRTYRIEEMPQGLAVALADMKLDASDPRNRVVKGAFVALGKNVETDALNKAKSWWEEAQLGGEDVSELMPFFTDKYEFQKELDAIAKQDSGNDAPM